MICYKLVGRRHGRSNLFRRALAGCIALGLWHANPVLAQGSPSQPAVPAKLQFLPPDSQASADELKLSPLLQQVLGVEFGLTPNLPPALKAFQYRAFEVACQAGDPRACEAMAAITTTDPKQVLKFSIIAAQGGSVDGMMRAATMLINGIGGEKNPTLGIEWFKLVNRLGVPEARKVARELRINWQNSGPSLEQLQKMKRDEAGYRAWYTLALTGYPEAAYQVGLMLMQGAGVSADKAHAYRWFKRAALHAHPSAMFMLGQASHEGNILPKNLGEAMVWLSLARNHAPASDLRTKIDATLEQVQRELNPDQLAAARSLLPEQPEPARSSDADRQSRELR